MTRERLRLHFPPGGSDGRSLSAMFLCQMGEMLEIAAKKGNLEATCFYIVARHSGFHRFIIKARGVHGGAYPYLIRRYDV